MKFEKLKNIVEVKKGKKPSFVETPDENSVRVLQIEDLRNDTSPKFTNDKTGVLAKEDDVLIAWDGANAGTIGYGKSGYIGSTIALLRKKQPDLYSTTFIGIFLQSQYQYLRSKTTGATIPHISRKALDDLEIPIINVNDQLHIANILSKAENLIAQRKESIRLLDEFLKSTFLEMFGDPVRNEKRWEKVVLGDVCRKIGSGSTPRGGKESYQKEGISLIRSLNVHNDEFVYKDLAFIDDKQAHELRNVIIEENDVLLNITGASVARCCIVPKEILPARVNQHVSIIRPDANILNPRFISRMFTCENYQLKLVKDAKSKGATREAITKEEVKLMKVIAPPIELQTQFAQIVEKTEALKARYQQSLQELENLYGSLSQKAFRGELRLDNKEESLLMAAEPEPQYQATNPLPTKTSSKIF